MKIEILVLFVALFLCAEARGEGAYQQTAGRKTLVWNDGAGPNELADWSGQRDEDGYATGYGTLIWYRTVKRNVIGSHIPFTRKVIVSRISGNMKHGKLEPTAEEARTARKTARPKVIDEGRTVSPPRSAELSDPSEKPSAAVTESGKTDRPSLDSESIRQQTTQRAIAPLSADPSSLTLSSIPHEQASENDAARKAAEAGSSHGHDDLRALTGPPASLRTDPVNGAAPPASPVRPHLSKAEVIRLADEQARSDGYSVVDYQRRQVIYSAPNDTWSVSYNQKPGDGAAASKHFGVTVEDKTNRTSLTPGK